MNLFCFFKVAHIHTKHIYNEWRHFQLPRQVWTFNWGHKMLKYALVEVFGEKKKTTVNLGMRDNCRECYIISVA